MSEVYWDTGAINIPLTHGLILAQTFTPLWTHTMERIRWEVKPPVAPSLVKVSIQYLKPDGTPTGVDLASVTHTYFSLDPLSDLSLDQMSIKPIRLVEGTQYAFLIQLVWATGIFWPETAYVPAPSGYPRGKLIKSIDFGATWDTTDMGDLHFGEFGDPPVNPNPHNPPTINWAIGQISQVNYKTSVCIRVATTEPTKLKLHFTRKKPTPIEEWLPVRGSERLCLNHYTFNSYYSFDQLEKWDSLYHTFYVTGLKEGDIYWFCFLGESGLRPTTSVSPIFERTHPEAPPFTTIRRPDAPGIECRVHTEIGEPCPDHYLNIDEASPDGDTTCIIARWSATSARRDLYNIPDLLPIDEGPFDQVHITVRVRRQGGMPYAGGGNLALYTHGHVYHSDHFDAGSTSYHNIHWHVYNNPFTGQPWEAWEINALQIGVRLECYWGVGWRTDTYCTQVYSKIYHRCEAYG